MEQGTSFTNWGTYKVSFKARCALNTLAVQPPLKRSTNRSGESVKVPYYCISKRIKAQQPPARRSSKAFGGSSFRFFRGLWKLVLRWRLNWVLETCSCLTSWCWKYRFDRPSCTSWMRSWLGKTELGEKAKKLKIWKHFKKNMFLSHYHSFFQIP